jgi:hypothetical protein
MLRKLIKTLISVACAGCLGGIPLLSAAAPTGANLPAGDSRFDRERDLLPSLPAGPARWLAHWIIAPDAITGVNLMFLARRTFDLPRAPARAMVYVTADTRYQLFVNGSFVLRGPARSAAHHQSFDAFDVARFLRAGNNVLALRFHHTGLAQPYHEQTRPGLLVQLEMVHDGKTSILGTDRQWKMRRDPSWDSESPRINHWHDASVDIVDLRQRLDDWSMPGFDDSSWPAAASIVPGGARSSKGSSLMPGPKWWPAPQDDYVPQAITPPWTALVPRDLPLLSESPVKATRLVLVGKLADPAAAQPRPDAGAYRFSALPLLKLPSIDESPGDRSVLEGVGAYERGQSPLVVRGDGEGTSSFFVFDLGEVYNGHPRLDIDGPAGAIVDVLCVPYILDRKFDPTMLNSFTADRVVLSGRRQQWEAFFFKPTRYLAVVVRGAAEPVRLHFAGVTRISYPWTQRGRFATPENPWLGRFWQAGAKTIEVITTDAYTDNYRERRQYPQTSYYAAQGNYAAFGDTFLQRRYLIQNAEEQEPNGNLGMYAPMEIGRFSPFLDAQFFWVMSWRDYLLYSGDTATVRRLLPVAQRAMQRLAELAQPAGLIADPPYPYWIDHSNLDRRGAHFVVNALYALTLDDYAQTLDWLGEPGGEPCRRAAAGIREALRTKFWDPQRGLFAEALVEGRLSARFSEHANGIAVAAHIATPEQTQAILPRILPPDPDLVPVTSLFVYWTFAALCQSGRVDEGLAMLESRFAHQLKTGNGTLWEEWHLDRTMRRGFTEKNSRADAQGECGIFPLALTRYVGGLEPVAPGLREVLVRRVPSSLKNIQAVLPSPLGDLRVTWSTSDRSGELQAEVPHGLVAKLDLASVDAPAGRELLLDGRPIAATELAGPWYVIPEGAHRLTFRAR